jgi:hypothetical protein
MTDNLYYIKYVKYKNKYINLVNSFGGDRINKTKLDILTDYDKIINYLQQKDEEDLVKDLVKYFNEQKENFIYKKLTDIYKDYDKIINYLVETKDNELLGYFLKKRNAIYKKIEERKEKKRTKKLLKSKK